MRLFRIDLIEVMENDQRELRRVRIPEDEILHHLVERYHPSNPELRRVRFPLAEFINDPATSRLLLSEVWYREEKRLFNKSQRLNQEIAVVKTPWKTPEGKMGVVFLLHLAAGKNTETALKMVRNVMGGLKTKENRLIEKQRDERRFREEAERLERSIERRRRGGRRGKGGATP